MNVIVNIDRPARPTKMFGLFQVGEFLVVPSSGAVGLKISDQAIFFFDHSVYGKGSVCPYVPAEKEYEAPKSVHISVTN